jgi:hypothetical protein
MAVLDYHEHLISSDVIVFAFASGGNEFSQHFGHFEFGNLLRKLKIAHVLLRDSTDRWYQHGVIGIETKNAVVTYIKERAREYPRAISIGVSSGAYAALMYGQHGLRETGDEIIAISPITGKGDAVKPDFDLQWWRHIEHGPEHPPVPDLKLLFPKGPIPTTNAYISDGDGTWLDRKMAERIGIKNIHLIPGYTHAALARHMRDIGMLEKLIRGKE